MLLISNKCSGHFKNNEHKGTNCDIFENNIRKYDQKSIRFDDDYDASSHQQEKSKRKNIQSPTILL